MILEFKSVCKDYRNHWTYRRIPVLHSVSFDVGENEVFGLIGPNGAGKTTTFKCLMGFLRPTSGSIEFLGAPLTTEARASIGFLPEASYFYDHLTVRETLTFYGRLYGLKGQDLGSRVDEVLEILCIAHKRDAPLRTLSKGNLQRVGVAQAILPRPRLAILDEPMSGLDPNGRKQIREMIRQLQAEGTTIIFSSHILTDAEALCNRVAILVGGSVREIIDVNRGGRDSGYRLTVRRASNELSEALATIGRRAPADGGLAAFYFDDFSAARRAIETVLQSTDSEVESFSPAAPSLEERFLVHVGSTRNTD